MLDLMHDIEARTVFGPSSFDTRAPDSGNSEILALYGTEEQKKKWLEPLLAGGDRSRFSMTEPAPGGGADPTMRRTTAPRHGQRRGRNGHKRCSREGTIADIASRE